LRYIHFALLFNTAKKGTVTASDKVVQSYRHFNPDLEQYRTGRYHGLQATGLAVERKHRSQ